MAKSGEKVLCVGLCCLDIVMYCRSYPEEDSDQRCISHTWQRGGNASNNCTIFSEFKIPCEILGTLSFDIGGQFMKDDFQKHNISTENCHFYKECESPTSVVWINAQNGSRTIVHSNKNMPEVSFEDFKLLNLNNYSWIHFECRPHFDDMKKMIQHIRLWNAHGSNVVKISIEIEKPRLELMEVLELGDVVFVSKDFARACGFTNMISATNSLSAKLKPGGVLICAWGEEGACVKSHDSELDRSKAYTPEKMVNTLGAGDTFVAATILGMMKGQSLNSAINTGCKVAGAKCGMKDTRGLSELFPALVG